MQFSSSPSSYPTGNPVQQQLSSLYQNQTPSAQQVGNVVEACYQALRSNPQAYSSNCQGCPNVQSCASRLHAASRKKPKSQPNRTTRSVGQESTTRFDDIDF